MTHNYISSDHNSYTTDNPTEYLLDKRYIVEFMNINPGRPRVSIIGAIIISFSDFHFSRRGWPFRGRGVPAMRDSR